MGHEQLTPDEFQQVLVNEYGVIFFPKRPLEIPHITRETLIGKVKPRRENTALKDIKTMEEFLLMPAIGDGFEDNHKRRVEWIGFIMKEFGRTSKEFIDNYAGTNQFRLNNLTIIWRTFINLSEKLVNPFNRYLFNASNYLFDYLEGETLDEKPYSHIKDIHKKLKIVHKFEDTIISELEWLITLPSSLNTAPIKIG